MLRRAPSSKISRAWERSAEDVVGEGVRACSFRRCSLAWDRKGEADA